MTPTNNSSNGSEFFDSNPKRNNLLWKYIQTLPQETVARLSHPTPEVAQIMEHNLAGILGTLPSEEFGVGITTSRENLGKLLASAMMSGYFLHSANQRMGFERAIGKVDLEDRGE